MSGPSHRAVPRLIHGDVETPDPAEARRAMQEEYRLADDLGVPLADLIRAQAAEAEAQGALGTAVLAYRAAAFAAKRLGARLDEAAARAEDDEDDDEAAPEDDA